MLLIIKLLTNKCNSFMKLDLISVIPIMKNITKVLI